MRTSVFSRSSWLLLGTAVFLAAPGLGRAQGQLAATEDLKKAYNASEARLRELYSGADSASGKADKKHAEVAAQWFLYRLTIKAFLTPPLTPIGPNGAEKLQKEFHDKVTDIMHKSAVGKNGEFRKMFGAALVSSMKDVLARDVKADPTTVVHAAAMLTDMARLKQDEVNAYLCDLAKDGKNPVVQLHALKALREAMPIYVQPDPDDFAGVNAYNARKPRDIKNVDALRQFIDRPVNTAGMTADEYKAVIFVRREAIISLAQAGSPAVIATPNKKMAVQPEGVAAHTLLNVLAGNVQPPPSLQEKIEAALGLCSMRYPNMPEYEPQVAIYLIAKTFDEFVADYNKDWINFAAVGPGRKLPYVAYLGDARRWQAGFKDLAANTPNPSAKSAKELDAISAPILRAVIGTAKEKYLNPEARDVNQLKALVPQLRPKTGYIFKTLKMPEIPLGK